MRNLNYNVLILSYSTVNDLLNVWGIYLILSVQVGCQIDWRHLQERGFYFHNCNQLNKTKMLLAKMSREFRNSRISTPPIDTSTLPRVSNPDINVRIVGHCYCVAIVSLSLL